MAKNAIDLNEKQQLFCDLYLTNRNGTKSYALAYEKDIDSPEGKEKNYANVSSSASALLSQPKIQKYLEEKIKENDFERELSESEIIAQLNKMALGNQYKENIRLDALKTLAKMKNMFTDEEANKEATVNIQIGDDIKALLKKSDN